MLPCANAAPGEGDTAGIIYDTACKMPGILSPSLQRQDAHLNDLNLAAGIVLYLFPTGYQTAGNRYVGKDNHNAFHIFKYLSFNQLPKVSRRS